MCYDKNSGSWLSAADVAQQSGYGDCRVFTKVYKKDEGMPPSQYRRDFRKTARKE